MTLNSDCYFLPRAVFGGPRCAFFGYNSFVSKTTKRSTVVIQSQPSFGAKILSITIRKDFIKQKGEREYRSNIKIERFDVFQSYYRNQSNKMEVSPSISEKNLLEYLKEAVS